MENPQTKFSRQWSAVDGGLTVNPLSLRCAAQLAHAAMVQTGVGRTYEAVTLEAAIAATQPGPPDPEAALCLAYKALQYQTHGACPKAENQPELAAQWRAEEALFVEANISIFNALAARGIDPTTDPRCNAQPGDPLDYTAPEDDERLIGNIGEIFGPEIAAKMKAGLVGGDTPWPQSAVGTPCSYCRRTDVTVRPSYLLEVRADLKREDIIWCCQACWVKNGLDGMEAAESDIAGDITPTPSSASTIPITPNITSGKSEKRTKKQAEKQKVSVYCVLNGRWVRIFSTTNPSDGTTKVNGDTIGLPGKFTITLQGFAPYEGFTSSHPEEPSK
jgi:hypothetical protein